ncbi:MAG: hypothetical protein HUU11_02790 [Anaerolineales bacterium]|nr:hypothetical protein [Anaerolineales bacterium]NUQ83617.1 hypothetical protein [Anaerolineales bacterium]
METQTFKKIEQGANDSRTLGIWSVGLLIILTLSTLLNGNIVYRDIGLVLGCLFTILLFFDAASALLACVFAVIAFWRNTKAGNHGTVKKTAVIGLILGGIPLVILPIIFLCLYFSHPSSLSESNVLWRKMPILNCKEREEHEVFNAFP